MNELSCFLKKFYTTKGNKFVFLNGISLNHLADEIWQEMGGKGMDSSALSKILKGRRNFTSLQLKVFCDLLKISDMDRVKLERFNLLTKNKKGADKGSFFLHESNIDYLYHLIDYSFDTLYRGDCSQLTKITQFLERMIDKSNPKHSELHFLILYLKGRIIGSLESGNKIILKTFPIVEEMKKINISSPTMKNGLISTLEGNSCYVNAEYGSNFYESISKGINIISTSIKEKFLLTEKAFSHRNLIALSLLTEDKKIIRKSLQTAEAFIQETISDDNAAAMLHLGETISLGHVHSDNKKVFTLLDTYRNEFQTSVKERGNYTVSGIKNELKMHSLVGNDKSERFRTLLRRGIKLSKKYNYPRYLKFFRSFN